MAKKTEKPLAQMQLEESRREKQLYDDARSLLDSFSKPILHPDRLATLMVDLKRQAQPDSEDIKPIGVRKTLPPREFKRKAEQADNALQKAQRLFFELFDRAQAQDLMSAEQAWETHRLGFIEDFVFIALASPHEHNQAYQKNPYSPAHWMQWRNNPAPRRAKLNIVNSEEIVIKRASHTKPPILLPGENKPFLEYEAVEDILDSVRDIAQEGINASKKLSYRREDPKLSLLYKLVFFCDCSGIKLSYSPRSIFYRIAEFVFPNYEDLRPKIKRAISLYHQKYPPNGG